MALKAVLDSAPPEAVKEHYTERDGKFYLQAEGMVSESDHVAVKTKLNEFRTNNVALLKKIDEEFKPTLARFEGIDPEEFKALKAEQEKLTKKGIKGADDIGNLIQEAVSKATKPLSEKLGLIEQERARLKSEMDQAKLRETIAAVGAKAGLKSKAVPYVQNKAEDYFKVVDGKIEPKNGDELTPEDWLKSLAKEDDFLFEASTGGGASTTAGKGIPAGAKILKNPTAMELGRNAADIAAGKIIVVRE